MNILITGGAGFIGQHLSKSLLNAGHEVRIIDNLTPQVHEANPGFQPLASDGQFIKGDVRDSKAMEKALDGVEVIYHLAAQTGVGQSMYEINDYVDCNVGGCARLWELLAADRRDVKKVIVASSRAAYGEGKYNCRGCGVVYPPPRSQSQMERAEWEIKCPHCSGETTPCATDEDKPLRPGSVYAITKRDQEELSLCLGEAYKIPSTALRFFNVYGSGQSLTNPYTGIITIFASRIRSGNPPQIYEDGLESRDFVHVSDVVQALILAMSSDASNYQVINVGSGVALSVLDMAKMMVEEMGLDAEPEVIGKYRIGDIRHCHADLTRASRLLGYKPEISFVEGLREFLDWSESRQSEDRLDTATKELEKRGLFK